MSAIFNQQFTPVPTPETQPYWEGLRNKELRLCRCQDCQQFYFPPSPVCQHRTSQNIEWRPVSGKAILYSYVINHRPLPEWQTKGPMSIALVDLEEGPRLITTIVNCEQSPQALKLDMKLQANYRDFAGTIMLCFEPTNAP